MSKQPIGIFDSGIGGLSILKAIKSILPSEDLIYIGDTAFLPYGNKNKTIIKTRAFTICNYLLSQHCKSIVVACNTATSAAIADLRNELAVPIIGIEPAIKPATERTQNRIIGILATEATLDGKKFTDLKSKFGQKATIFSQACVGLVEEIEAGELGSPRLHDLIKMYVEPLIDKGADTLVLGCTHFPLVKQIIRKYSPPGTTIIDPSASVASELKRQLYDKGLLRAQQEGSVTLLKTGENDNFNLFTKDLLGSANQPSPLNL